MKVYVNWYGRTLEGEVVDGSGFAGMTPVRIPLDDHHPVALFMPQHVFASADQVKGNSPIISPNSPKVEAGAREISRIEPKASQKDWPTPEEYAAQVYVSTLVQQFKESHWDEAHNHLQTEYLEEFYQLWRKAHDCRQPNAEAPVTCQSHTPKPMSVQPVPQNSTPSIAKLLHKKSNVKTTELSLFD